MEHVLLLLFLAAGVYMFLGAREFPDAAAEFPRIMAGGTSILAFLILVRNYLHAVVPVLATVLGGYAVYTGGTTFLAGEGGLLRMAIGVGLIVAVVGFREQLVDVSESFIAEPMQVLGEDDLIGDDTDDAVDSEGEAIDPEEREAEESDSGAMYVYEIDDPKGPIVTGLLCLGYMGLAFAIGMLYATPVFVAVWALWARMEFARGAALTGLGLVCSYLFYDLIQSDISEGWLTGWEPTPPDDLYEQHLEPIVPLALDVAPASVDVVSASIDVVSASVGVAAVVDVVAVVGVVL